MGGGVINTPQRSNYGICFSLAAKTVAVQEVEDKLKPSKRSPPDERGGVHTCFVRPLWATQTREPVRLLAPLEATQSEGSS